nr:hypothetical protein J1836_014590 [Thiothrix fructosivorans]
MLILSVAYFFLPSKTSSIGELGMQFEYMGCVGDWSDDQSIKTIITKEDTRNTSFLVQNPATCGFDSASQASYKIEGDTLILSYKYDELDGALAACICKYQSRFTFKDSPVNINHVEFHSQGS